MLQSTSTIPPTLNRTDDVNDAGVLDDNVHEFVASNIGSDDDDNDNKDHLGTIGRMFILSRKMKRSTIRLKYLDSLRGGQRNRRYCAMLTEIVEVGERREENVCPV